MGAGCGVTVPWVPRAFPWDKSIPIPASRSGISSASTLHRDSGLKMGILQREQVENVGVGLCTLGHPCRSGGSPTLGHEDTQNPLKPPGSWPWHRALPLIWILFGLPDS